MEERRGEGGDETSSSVNEACFQSGAFSPTSTTTPSPFATTNNGPPTKLQVPYITAGHRMGVRPAVRLTDS